MKEIADEALRERADGRNTSSGGGSARRADGDGRDAFWDELGTPGDAAPARGRGGAPVPARLHLRHDRPAEGRAARPGRLPASRSPARPRTRRTSSAGDRVLFATDMGWIMGPWTVVGAGALGATIVYMEGAPDWPARPALAAGRGGARDDARRLADAGPRVDPEGRAGRRSLVAPRRHDDRRAVEPRPVRLAGRARLRRRADSDREHLRRHGGRRLLPLGHADGADEAGLARVPRARPGDGRLRAGRRAGARRGRRARLHAALAGDDARDLG